MCQGETKELHQLGAGLAAGDIKNYCNTYEGQGLLLCADFYVGFAKRRRVSHSSLSPGNCKAGNQPREQGAAPAASDLSDNTHANKLKSNKFNDFDTIYGFKSN